MWLCDNGGVRNSRFGSFVWLVAQLCVLFNRNPTWDSARDLVLSEGFLSTLVGLSPSDISVRWLWGDDVFLPPGHVVVCARRGGITEPMHAHHDCSEPGSEARHARQLSSYPGTTC